MKKGDWWAFWTALILTTIIIITSLPYVFSSGCCTNPESGSRVCKITEPAECCGSQSGVATCLNAYYVNGGKSCDSLPECSPICCCPSGKPMSRTECMSYTELPGYGKTCADACKGATKTRISIEARGQLAQDAFGENSPIMHLWVNGQY